ncbi:type II toxin-antitoxin system MqsA family antitoxin [Methanocalculus chunghsingensis]|uniref:type II toxin-antitoxin system MqsA family antitoxin n=1 Tax=Methanocalculus chunghsingensis TaxID=156457 RepID=UPI001B8ADB89|nr:type II toxin-antitoxin system MqsA family antitoxin [Methanocalculus chunghsingensis]
MNPEKCSLCKGALTLGTTECIARVHKQVIVIRDVPAYVCRQCGGAYFSAETSRKIDVVMEAVHQGTICCRPLAAGEITLPA